MVRIFNTPIEIGIRSLVILNEGEQDKVDIERLMYVDYLSLNTFDIGGPESLHAPIPNRGVQVYSKKEIIQKGLVLLLSKELVKLSATEDGFMYSITEAGRKFLEFFQTKYFQDLVSKVKWVNENFKEYSTTELKEYIDTNIQRWGSEFIVTNDTDNNL